MKQVLETTIPVKIVDLVETLPQVQVALTQGASIKGAPSNEEKKDEAQGGKENNTLFTIGMGRTPAVVEMEILGYKLSNTIVDGGSGVNVLSNTLATHNRETHTLATHISTSGSKPIWNQANRNLDGIKGSNWYTTILPGFCVYYSREEGV